MSYVYDKPQAALVPRPAAALAADPAVDDHTLRNLLLLALAAVAVWLLIRHFSRGGRGGRNKVARVLERSDGWYFKLVRKRAAARGPYASEEDAVAAAEAAGYRVLTA